MSSRYKSISILSPCSIGDTLYVPVFKNGSLVVDDGYKVMALYADGDTVSTIFAEVECEGNVYSRSFDLDNLNKTFFTNRKEAEQFCVNKSAINRCPKDCLSCANSFSDDVGETHVLRCVLKDDKIVDENFCCEDYN